MPAAVCGSWQIFGGGVGRNQQSRADLPSDPVDGWTNRWIESKHKTDFGKFVLNAGKFYGDLDKDKGKSLGIGHQIQEDFLEEVLGTAQPGHPQEQGRRRKWGESSVSLILRVPWGLGPAVTSLPSPARAADEPGCPLLRPVDQI